MDQQLDMINEAAIRHKKKAGNALIRLQFDLFQTEISQAIKIQPYLADLQTLKSVGKYLKNRFSAIAGIPDFLAQVWYDIPAAIDRSELTPGMGRYTDHLLAKAAQVKNVVTEQPFIDSRERLHHSCLLMAAGNYETARKHLLETLISTHPLRAGLWGYYGDVNVLLSNFPEAGKAYIRALILAPKQLDLFRLKSEELRHLYTTLRRKYSDAEARSLLLIIGWLEGIITIPKGGDWLAQQFKGLQDQLTQALPSNKHERWHRFSICLYLDQSKPIGQIDYEAREQMMELDRELFEKYLGKLEKDLKGF